MCKLSFPEREVLGSWSADYGNEGGAWGAAEAQDVDPETSGANPEAGRAGRALSWAGWQTGMKAAIRIRQGRGVVRCQHFAVSRLAIIGLSLACRSSWPLKGKGCLTS